MAVDVMDGFWPEWMRTDSKLNHNKAMGMDMMSRRTIVLCRVCDNREPLRAPNACEAIPSIPVARPDMKEYPVMFATPMARLPPARAVFPSFPIKNMEIAAFE